MGTMHSDEKYKEFIFDESGNDENPRWSSATGRKKKSLCGDSSVDNYTFLESVARGTAFKGKALRSRTIIVHEVDEAMNERINRSDTALQSSSSNHNSKKSQSRSPVYLASHKAATDRKASDRDQQLHVADHEFVSITSDEDIENSSTMSCNDLADAEGERGLEHEITSHDVEVPVVLQPECVTFGRSRYSSAQLFFYCNVIKLVVSEEGATGCLTFEWKTLNLISIGSRWLEPFNKAEVCLIIKPDHSQKSGILEVKCTLSDPCWSDTQDRIKSLDEQYKEKCDGDLDSYELFEDVTYLEGDGDSIAIYKRDFALLQPEKFINDTIVDFYIEYLKKIKPAATRVHFFNSFFFSKLADFDENQSRSINSEEAFQRVRKWTKKVNIFQKDYIFMPVNFRLHWSLIVICHPGEAVNFTDDELELSQKVPCILHMDSIIGSHRGLENCIKCYLWEEWKERNTNASEYTSSKFMDLRFIRLEVPQQENSYDCGLFMLHYMELFVKQASNNFNPLNNFIDKDWFYPIEASLKRARIKRLIFELTKSNAQQVLSPKLSYGLKDEDDEEDEEADVEILHETCNSKGTCGEHVFNTCVNKSSNVTPSTVEPVIAEHMETNGGSSVADNEQTNDGRMVLYDPSINVVSPVRTKDGQMVLYDPSTNAMSPIKKSDEAEDYHDKQIPEGNKTNVGLMRIRKSLNLLQLKEKSGGDDDVVESHVVEDSDDDNDVFETCVVEDSASDQDSCELFTGRVNNNCQKISKRRPRGAEGSPARKRPRSRS